MQFQCAHCGKTADRPAGHVNRSRAQGMKLYCGRRCSGLGRRDGKTKAERKEEKRLYDLKYRAKNLKRILARKKEYHKRTYDPVKAAEHRKTRMPYHVEYCRRPEYRVKKAAYDQKRRDAEYGEFAEVARLTIDLNREIKGRMTNAEIKWENETANKSQFRKRAGNPEKERSRPRNRWRSRPGVAAPHG